MATRCFRAACAASLLMLAATSVSALTPAQVCEAGKNFAAGKYTLCRGNVQAKYFKTHDLDRYLAKIAVCDEKFLERWALLEAAAGGACPTTSDDAALQSFITDHTDEVKAALAPGGLLPACGDDVVNAINEQCDGDDFAGESCQGLGFGFGTLSCTANCRFDTSACPYPGSACGNGSIGANEQCEGSHLAGQTCQTLGFNGGSLSCTRGCIFELSNCIGQALSATGQTSCWDTNGATIPCAGTGQDGEVQAGTPRAFVDNGDGTISDVNSGLMWAKHSDDGSINDKDNVYVWDDAFSVHIAGLNAATFAGYSDWRLPNTNELRTLRNAEADEPALDAVFSQNCVPGCTVLTCSCPNGVDTGQWRDWSSSTYQDSPIYAWSFNSAGGYEGGNSKLFDTLNVRAVRGGI